MIPVYVINLDRSDDRMDLIAGRLSQLGVPFVRIPAIDGASLSPDLMIEYGVDASTKAMGRPLLAGEVGCFLSHRLAAETFLESGAPLALVLKDDAFPPDEMQAILAGLSTLKDKPGDWDVANLGRPPKRFHSPYPAVADLVSGLVRAHYFPITTTALLWRREGARRFLTASSTFAEPVDRFLQNWCIASNRGLAMQPPAFRTIDAPSVIEQADSPGRRYRTSRNGLRRVRQLLGNHARAYLNWRRAV